MRGNRKTWEAVLVGAGLTTLVCGLALHGEKKPYVEGVEYARMAEGERSGIYPYYAGRIFHPWISGLIRGSLGASTSDAFRLSTGAGVGLLVVGVLVAARRAQVPWLWCFGVGTLLTPPLLKATGGYYFQDVVFNGLLAIALVLYERARWLAYGFLLAAFLTRESAILILMAILGVELLLRRRKAAIAALALVAVSVVLRQVVSAGALENKHGMGLLSMYLLKAPFNFCLNVLGLVFWTDTNQGTAGCVPVWSLAVPSWLPLGRIRVVGFCGWDAGLPLGTTLLYLTSFGLFGLGLRWALREGGLREALRREPSIAVAGAYGALVALTTPLIGTWPSRYMIYCWPLFWAFVPGVLGGEGMRRLYGDWRMLAAHFGLCWMPVIAGAWGQTLPGKAALVAAAVGIWVWAWREGGRRMAGWDGRSPGGLE